MTDRLRRLLSQITKRLVNTPDQVKIYENVGATSVVFEISVSKEEVGKIIGKRGQTIGAIRTIMRSAAGKIGKRVYIEVKD